MARSLRSFMIAFLFSLVAFAIAAAIIVPFLDTLVVDVFTGGKVIENTEEKNNEKTDEKNNESEGDKPADDGQGLTGKTFTVLFIIPDENNKYADTLLLMKVDRERKSFMFSALPPRLKVSVSGSSPSGGEPITLASIYKTHDCKYLASQISSVTGLNVNYYYCITSANFKKLVDSFGGVEVNVPYDMEITDPETKEVLQSLSAGKQMLDGNKALIYTSFNDYVNGDEGRRTVQLNFLKLFLNSILTENNFSDIDGFYAKLFTNIKVNTNINADIFKNNADLLFKFSNYRIAPTVVFPTDESEIIGETEYYSYVIADALEAYKEYK